MKKQQRNILFMILAVVVVLGIFLYFNGGQLSNTFGIVGVGSTNLLANPGFESSNPSVVGFPANWTTGGDTTHLITWDSTTKHSGVYSLHFQVLNSSKSFYQSSAPLIPTSPGKQYVITGWIKTANLPAFTGSDNTSSAEYLANGYPSRIMMEMSEFSSTNTAQRLRASATVYLGGNDWDLNRNKDWTQYSAIYTVGANTTYFMPRLFLYSTSGDVWYDDFSIQEIVSDPNVLVSNGGFELWSKTHADTNPTNGSTSSLALGWYGGQYGAILDQSTDAHSGTYSYQVTTNPIRGSYIAQQTNFLLPGHRYEYSAWVKASGGSSAATVFIHAQQTILPSYSEVSGSSTSVPVSTLSSWKQITSNFVVSNSTPSVYRILIESTYPNVVFKVDDVAITDLGVAVSCTTLSTCSGNQTCSLGYCTQINCISGFHPENHLCVKDPISCATGYHYDTTTQGCVADSGQPQGNNNVLWIVLGIVAVVVIIFFVVRRK